MPPLVYQHQGRREPSDTVKRKRLEKMKTDKIIARLMEYCNTLDESDRKLINQFMERDETSKLPGIFTLATF